jgi:hypothetical protein
MIYSDTLRSLTEDELSILFLIFNKFFEPFKIEAKYNFLKMLRVDITCKLSMY